MKYLLTFFLLMSFQVEAQITEGEARALRPEALRLWQKRVDSSALGQALSNFEKMHEGLPQDREILLYLARGYFLMGEYHSTDKKEKMRHFEKSKDYGMKGMELNPEFKKIAKDKLDKAVEKLTAEDAPLTFWTAASLGKWSKLNGVMSSLKWKDPMLAMIRKVEEVTPDYFYGAVPRFWGSFYALAPGFVGGDMKKSKENFKKAQEVAPEYLGTQVLYAESYLVEEGEKKEFEKVLQDILLAPLGPTEIQPENSLEKQKAERLLGEKKKLF